MLLSAQRGVLLPASGTGGTGRAAGVKHMGAAGKLQRSECSASCLLFFFLIIIFLFLFSLVVVVNDSAEIQSLPEGSAFLVGCCRQASLERPIASHQYFWQASAGAGSIGNYFHFTEYIKIFLRKKRQVEIRSGDRDK